MHSQFTEHIVLDSAAMRLTEDGYLVASPRVARTGIQLYSGSVCGRPDLDFVRVYRPEHEVFSRNTMTSLAHRPITNGHPPDMVDAKNWRKHAVGHTSGDVARDGDFIRVPLILMDQEAIDAVKSGKSQLSVGYTSDVRWGKGRTQQGEDYDATQTDVRANHIALVSMARGGPQLRIGDTHMHHVTDAYGFPAGHRPGYVFADATATPTLDELRAAADQAYKERNQRLQNAWRRNQDDGDQRDSARVLDAAQLRALADAAYEQRKKDLQNAWRNRLEDRKRELADAKKRRIGGVL